MFEFDISFSEPLDFMTSANGYSELQPSFYSLSRQELLTISFLVVLAFTPCGSLWKKKNQTGYRQPGHVCSTLPWSSKGAVESGKHGLLLYYINQCDQESDSQMLQSKWGGKKTEVDTLWHEIQSRAQLVSQHLRLRDVLCGARFQVLLFRGNTAEFFTSSQQP